MTFDATTANAIARLLGIRDATFHIKHIGERDGECVVRCSCSDAPMAFNPMTLRPIPPVHLQRIEYARRWTDGRDPLRSVTHEDRASLYVGQCPECGYVLVATPSLV